MEAAGANAPHAASESVGQLARKHPTEFCVGHDQTTNGSPARSSSMQFRGTVLDGAAVVAHDVEGTYQSDSFGGASKSWSGRMSVPANAVIREGESYTLRMADGTEVTITVSEATSTGGSGRVWFKGKGRAP
jgi:hypothetical protein